MTSLRQNTNKRNTLNIRIKVEDRQLIDRAAEMRGKTRTDFILEVARKAAEETLIDQLLISVNQEVYQEFLDLLDAPIKPNDALKETMQIPAPWE